MVARIGSRWHAAVLRALVRIAVCVAALAALVAVAPQERAYAADWKRLWGENAYDTMRAVVGEGDVFASGSGGTVIVATGDGYWDALAASGLAGRLDAPVMITPASSLCEQARAEIARIAPDRILVMGGPLALSDAVVGQLRGMCQKVERIYGAAAPDTAVAIFRAGSGWSRTAVIATSDGYWDALSIAPYSYACAAPIFLTRSSADSAGRTLSDASIQAIRAGGFTRAIIVGGSLAVSGQVEGQLRSIGCTPVRLWGENAIDTSAEIARWELGQGMKADGMGVATADGFWDALTGAALCGKLNSVIALTNPGNYVAIDAVLGEHRDEISRGYVFGGALAVPAATYDYLCGRKAASGPLRVSGGSLVDGQGNRVQLRGISTHGLAWFGQYVNAACFSELKSSWHADVVRLALYTEEYGGYCSGGDRTQLLDLVRKGIRDASSAGLYVIVDWHILSDGNPLTHLDDAKGFLSTIAREFGAQGNVLYEICNEPNGGTSWDDITRYANEVIPAIRANDPDGVVIVGTPTWSQEVDKALARPLRFDNVMYALHFYAATHREDLRNRMVSCAQQGLPIFVTEFGICDASGGGQIDEASADAWVASMNTLGISYCMWSLCNKAESASAIASSCQKTSGFGTQDLAPAGKWLYRTLTSDKAYARLPEGGGSSGDGNGASGGSSTAAQTLRQGSLELSVRLVNSWPSGSSTCYQYELSVTNRGGAVSSWEVRVPFSQTLSLSGDAWNARASATGSVVTLSSMEYNGALASGATATGIGFIVSSGAGLTVR